MSLNELSAVRVLKHVVRPGAKYGAASRSIAYFDLALRSKRKSVLFATFPKSGWNWSAEVLDYAIARHRTGAYLVRYEGEGTLKQRQVLPPSVFSPADSRSVGRRRVRDMFPGVDVDYCLHTHGCWREAPLFGLDAARTVIVARDIPTTLYSYFRSRGGVYPTLEACLEAGALDRVVRFYNGWGDFAARAGGRARVFRYEALRAEPVAGFRDMFQFVFGYDAGESVVNEAVDYYAFARQKEREWRFAKDESRHFHFRGGTDYRDLIAPATLERIQRELRARLRHAFGYDHGGRGAARAAAGA